VVVLVDRQEENGIQAIRSLVPDVVSLITRDELLAMHREMR
jgi:orotate phosphoribosyltransferase